MIGLAYRSLRHRMAESTATFLTVLMGSALIGSFATLAETGTGLVTAADAEALWIMGGVVGGWGTVIVLFSTASAVGITATYRATELGLIRTVGATPRQVRRLVQGEVLLVAVVAATLGAVVAYVGGAGLLALVRGNLISETVAYGASPVSVGAAAGAVVVTSVLASSIAVRRATGGPARLVLAEAASGASRMRWWRVVAGLLLIAQGIAMAVITVTVTADDPDPYAAMQTSGSASIVAGVGLAALAPLWLRWVARLLPASRLAAPAHLAVGNACHRAHLLASVLAPVIVLSSAAIGVLMLVGIDGRTLADEVEGAELVTMLNYVVTGMIVLFAVVMVVNGVASMLAHRRPELARLRLAGATPPQVRSSLVIEALIVALVGVVLGSLASLTTVLPFAHARGEGLVPDGQWWLPPLICLAAIALTIVTTRLGVRRLPTPSTVNR